MNPRIINMLESIKRNTYTNPDEYLNVTDIEAIRLWYSQYATSATYDIEKCIDLLYFLYIRENIEFYPYEEFQKIVSSIAQIHGFEIESFWDILAAFRKTVFND